MTRLDCSEKHPPVSCPRSCVPLAWALSSQTRFFRGAITISDNTATNGGRKSIGCRSYGVWILTWIIVHAMTGMSFGQAVTSAVDPRGGSAARHPSRLLVRFLPDPSAAAGTPRTVSLPPGCSVWHWSETVADLCVMSVPEDSVDELLAELRADPMVAYAEPDYMVEFTRTPNDPWFGLQWGMENVGQTADNDPGLMGADARAFEAWDIWTGDPGFKIAVTDTGVSFTHPDLAANMWTNPGEIPGNGVDDDENGWIDDIHGYNMQAGHGIPFDTDGHGTHIAGIIGAAGDNGIGVAGMNWECQIVALKIGDASGAFISTILIALDYILANDIPVSNNSWGCYECFSQAMYDSIEALGNAGHLFVAAAGNGFLGLGTDNDAFPYYPASYDLDNIIAVAALNNNDRKPKTSNFGKRSVDVSAPGINVYSTFLDSGYAFLDGTSMAAPHVTGLVALVAGRQPDLPWQNVRARIIETARPVQAMEGRSVSEGIIDALAAVGDCNRNGLLDEVELDGPGAIDCDGNSLPDDCDPDCNSTSIVDRCDILSGSSTDCNTNEIPDECEPDCNANGMADACDITDLTSTDCNDDGVPDECQVGFFLDCNNNGEADLCDIASETSTDCNDNLIPDECDIATGLSEDCSGNGLPDPCERDCNENGVADSCDILNGTSTDGDADAIPDECSLGFELVPIDSTGEFFIEGRDIFLVAGGFTVTLEPRVSGWDPDQDGVPRVVVYQAMIDQNSFISDETGTLSLATLTCVDNDDCLASAECANEGICEPTGSWNIDESHLNYLFAGIPAIALSDVLNVRLGGVLFEQDRAIVDRGVPKYLGTLIVDVPENASGTFTITFSEVNSFLADVNNSILPIAGYHPARITILPDCNDNGIPDRSDIKNETSEDCDGDGVPDECVQPEGDCNSNGQPDLCDIDQGISFDCNANGIPDDCIDLETDCNNNRFPDECDIEMLRSTDCNGNGIPDECSWLEIDCNNNNHPDECDISRGTFQDCNNDSILDVCQFDCNFNGLADECDIASGLVADLDENGVPDNCQNVLRVPAEYPTIQAGIDAAGRGDTVLVAPGTYTGTGNHSVEFSGKLVTVRCDNDTPSCTIDAVGQQFGFSFLSGEGRGTVLDGFTISGAWNMGIVVSRSSPTIRQCVIEGNGPTSSGILLLRQSEPLIENCTIRRNASNFGGGGIRSIEASKPTIRRCLISENFSTGRGGGVFADFSDITITDTTIMDNTSAIGGGGLALRFGTPTVDGCIIVGNSATQAGSTSGEGGGVSCDQSNALIANSLIEGNFAGLTGGGIYLSEGETQIVNCTLIGNRAVMRGGGIHMDGNGRDVWACCGFAGCSDLTTKASCDFTAGTWYPGLDCTDLECGTISCCLPDGTCDDLSFFSCIARGGQPNENGTQCATVDCNPNLTNSIVWSNWVDTGASISLSTLAPVLSVTSSTIAGGWPGVGNNTLDPDFVAEGFWFGGALWERGDHRLMNTSPSLDSGLNAVIAMQSLPADLDGAPRVLCGQVDRGAYERGIGDFNCDDIIDSLDYKEWASCLSGFAKVDPGCEAFDFDADASVNLWDFAAFQTLLTAEVP